MNILPWQEKAWQQLSQARAKNKLAHAFIFSGPKDESQKHFAMTFASAILCQTPTTEFACGSCQSCHLIQTGSHPDLFLIEPEEAGQMIKIDRIRSLIESVNETALLSHYRIVILNPAHLMNHQSANALLKTLEEPPHNTIFILVSDQAARLPITIRSRCQKIYFNHQEDDLDENTLQLQTKLLTGLIAIAEGKQSPITLAASLQEQDLTLLLTLLQTSLKELLIVKLTAQQSHEKYSAILSHISQENLFSYADHIKNIYAKIIAPINLNRLLVLEELFILWRQYVSG